MYLNFHVNYPLFLLDFNKSLNFLYRFSKNTQIAHFIKVCRVGAELFIEEGHKDETLQT